MMSASRLAGTLIPAMAFLSCVRPESWEPCVESRLRDKPETHGENILINLVFAATLVNSLSWIPG
uniref:Uncharacterized protein n=1 Tax=Homo sapiens TaxID=9606 RepID=A0A8V8TMI3_HUMAN